MRGSPVRVRLSAHFLNRESELTILAPLFFLIKEGSAELAQLVEHWLPKPRVAGSSPVFRSSKTPIIGAKREKLTKK